MRRLSLVLAVSLLVGWMPPAAADETATSQGAPPCANQFEVTRVDSDPATVVLHVRTNRPLAGTATLYGPDRMWTAAVTEGTLGMNRGGVPEQTAAVRAGGPILAVQFSPAWALCAMTAAVRPRVPSDVADPIGPAAIATDAGALPATTCSRPYASARLVHAALPTTPAMAQQQGIRGEVAVAVAIDAQGHVVGAALLRSPSAILNASAMASARASTYEPAIIGCRAVPSSYQFVVTYS